MPGLSCLIVVSGELDSRFDGAFGGLNLRTAEGTTELAGPIADQSELQGVLRQLFDLGLDIVSISTASETAHPGERSAG